MVKTENQIKSEVEKFILGNFLFGDSSRMPVSGDSFISKGIMDSTGILELIEFLESTFGFSVAEQETVPQNLDSIDNIVAFVSKRLA